MSTTPTSAPAPATPLWQQLLPIFEIGANLALVGLGAGGVIPANVAPIATALEGAIQPLIQSIQQGNTKTADAVIAFSALITALNVLKNQTGLDPATLAKITVWSTAAQAGLNGFLAGGQGFNPANYTPVTPV